MSWLSWIKRSPRSATAEQYRSKTSRKVAARTPIDALTFVVLDTETTGFDAVKDRILSLAVVPLKHGSADLSAMRSWMVFQPAPPLNDAVAVHGILPAETAEGEAEYAITNEFLPIASGAILVGHHIGFDLSMLNAALRRHHHISLRNPFIDTALMAMRTLDAFRVTAYPGQRPPSLEETCEHCGILPMERHTAAGDAFTTAELFLVLCARLRRLRRRALTAGDLPIERS